MKSANYFFNFHSQLAFVNLIENYEKSADFVFVPLKELIHILDGIQIPFKTNIIFGIGPMTLYSVFAGIVLPYYFVHKRNEHVWLSLLSC